MEQSVNCSGVVDEQQKMEIIKEIVLEFDCYSQCLEEEVRHIKKDHASLKREMTGLIDENRNLIQKFKCKTEAEMTEEDLALQLKEATLVRNLQHQLELISKERDTLKDMWCMSLQAITKLEEEIQVLKGSQQLSVAHKQLESMQHDYSDAIKLLEEKLSTNKKELFEEKLHTSKLEEEMTRLNRENNEVLETCRKLREELSVVEISNQKIQMNCCELEEKYSNLQKKYTNDKNKISHINDLEEAKAELQKKLEIVVKERNEAQAALERCQEHIKDINKELAFGREKVEESINLVEEISVERDNVEAKLFVTQAECERLQKELVKLIDEAGVRVNKEVQIVKEECGHQLQIANSNLLIIEKDRDRKAIEIEKLKEENCRLQSVINQLRQDMISREDEIHCERQYEEFMQKLHGPQLDIVQIHNENVDLRETLLKIQDRHRRCKIQKKQMEDQILMHQKQVEHLTKDLGSALQRTDYLTEQLHTMGKRLAETESAYYLDGTVNAAYPVDKVKEIENRNSELIKELQKHVDAHNDIAQKWKKEVEYLTDNIRTQLKKIKSDVKKSQSKNPDEQSQINQ